MNDTLIQIAALLRPDIKEKKGLNQALAAIFPLQVMFFGPIIVGGLIWLFTQTQLTTFIENGPIFLLFLVFSAALKRFQFLLVTEFEDGMYSISSTGLDVVVYWSGFMIFGPVIVWVTLAAELLALLTDLPGPVITADEGWQIAANQVGQPLAASLVGSIGGWLTYQALGGQVPLASGDIVPALAATGVMLITTALTVSIVIPMYTSIIRTYTGTEPFEPFKVFIRDLSLEAVGAVVAIPMAIVFSTLGAAFYLVLLAGITASSYIAHRLSQALEHNRQRSREMEQLERLARDIIERPPGLEGLQTALQEYIPGMFSFGRVEIRLFPDTTLVAHPPTARPLGEKEWQYFAAQRNELIIAEGETPPWGQEPIAYAMLYVPIWDVEDSTPIGGVYVRRYALSDQITALRAAARSLAAQIESAVRREQVYQQTIELERNTQELKVAGRIQERFLAAHLQEREVGIPGFDLTAYLEPARNMSGDFFDAIELQDGHWALIIADVADKGVAAALYMALSITLLRTYTRQHGDASTLPIEHIFYEVNNRLLEYARTDQFVTLFYLCLDPTTGQGIYANGGHNPPYILRTDGSREELTRTGIPLGMMEDWEWSTRSFTLNPGETLLMYTDGVTEARNAQDQQYDEGPFDALLTQCHDASTDDLSKAIIEGISDFVGDAPKGDDITLLILRRHAKDAT